MMYVLLCLALCNVVVGWYMLHVFKTHHVVTILYPILISLCSIEFLYMLHYLFQLTSAILLTTFIIYALKSIYITSILLLIYKQIVSIILKH